MRVKSKFDTFGVWPRRGRTWIFVLPILGLVGLFLTGQQLLPHLAVAYWRQQLADAPVEQVDMIIGQIAEWDEVGLPTLVEALASQRDAVATAAKHCLLEQMDRWKSLPEESCLTHMQTLVACLAEQIPKFGPTARRDAAELAIQTLLHPADSKGSLSRSRIIAACDGVLEAATATQGNLISPPWIQARISQPFEDPPSLRSVASERADAKDSPLTSAATHFDLLPGGGLPLRTPPPAEQENEVALPAEDAEMPPAFFQEPAGTRYMDFSNRTTSPLQVPETPSPRNARKNQSPRNTPRIRSLAHEESKTRIAQPSVELRSCETLKLMRQLAEADQNLAEEIVAELRLRGLAEQEIALAGRLFDPDPNERKRLIAELPGMADIDASAWLLQCCKDPDAEVRLSAFSLLATSTNPLLLRKVKTLSQNDADTRIRRLAEQINQSYNR